MPPGVKSKAGHAAKSIKAGDAFFQRYESKLQKAKIMAFIANVMYSLNWFLGFCALTWASAVILGGLLTSLSQHDYYSVVALLLLEAVRLSIITFFAKFVTWKLVRGSADPQRLVYNDARRQWLQGIARILEQAVQLTVIAISVLVPIRRLGDLNSFSAMRGFDGLQTSLYIFYVLVLVNGAIAGLAVIFSKNVVPFFVDSFSLRKYYETIVWKGMDEGLLHARDFELLSWTFQMQADEYRRNTRALVVKELYGDMMKFLYYHPRHKGFEAAKVALESEDTFEREAAANIVGLWVSLTAEVEKSAAVKKDKKADGKTRASASASAMAESKESGNKNASSMSLANPLARLLIQARLLEKLADALDSDESGRAATLSFEKLAETDPEGVLMVRSEGKDEKVADILMDRIHRAVELGKPDNAVIYIKAMIPLMTKLSEEEEIRVKQTMTKKKGKQIRIEEEEAAAEMEEESDQEKLIMTAGNGHEIGDYCTPAKLGRLKKDMWRIVSDANALKRVQAVAAHVFCCLCKGELAMHEKLWKHLMEEPKGKQHILKEEQQIFLKLPIRFQMTWPASWKGELIEVREPVAEKSTPRLPCLARPITALIATLFTLIILVVSSYFIMRYAHF